MYAASRDGQIIHIIPQVFNSGNKKDTDYTKCKVRKYGDKNQKTYQIHRFVWECYNGIIPNDKVINHINDKKEDNRLCNLRVVTQQENWKKSAKKRDYSFVANNHANRKSVMATNVETKDEIYFKSMYAAQKQLGINAGIVKVVCEGPNQCRTGISKIDGQRYRYFAK